MPAATGSARITVDGYEYAIHSWYPLYRGRADIAVSERLGLVSVSGQEEKERIEDSYSHRYRLLSNIFDRARKIREAEREACETIGGTWGRFGLARVEECNAPTSDAENPCDDQSDCQSSCITDDDIVPGEPSIGRCHAWTVTRGRCHNEVRQGIATGIVCED